MEDDPKDISLMSMVSPPTMANGVDGDDMTMLEVEQGTDGGNERVGGGKTHMILTNFNDTGMVRGIKQRRVY